MDEDMDQGMGAWADAAAGLGKPGSKGKGGAGWSTEQQTLHLLHHSKQCCTAVLEQ